MGQGRHRQVRRGRGVAAAVAAVLVVGAAVGIAVAAAHDSSPQSQSLKSAGSPTSSATPTTPSRSASPSRTAAAAAKPRPTKRPPTLALTVTGAASYLEVRLPNHQALVANTFGHGKRFVFAQPILDVVIGDAGAVRLETNGDVRAPAGKPGQVLRFRVGARR